MGRRYWATGNSFGGGVDDNPSLCHDAPMQTTRFAVTSTTDPSSYALTFRTVRTERAARLFVRLYSALGYRDIFGNILRFDYSAVVV